MRQYVIGGHSTAATARPQAQKERNRTRDAPSIQPALLQIVLVPAEEMAEFMKKGCGDFIAEILLPAIHPLPQVHQEKPDARQFVGIRLIGHGRPFEQTQFVANQLVIHFTRAGLFLHRNRHLGRRHADLGGQRPQDRLQFLIRPAAQCFKIHRAPIIRTTSPAVQAIPSDCGGMPRCGAVKILMRACDPLLTAPAAAHRQMGMSPLYEGKAKRMWTTDDPDTLRMEFKDDATAFDGKKKAVFESKGRLNCAISTLIYGLLEKEGVPTHFVRQIDETNVEVKKVDILMVEVIVRNLAAGNFTRRTGVPEGHVFSQPVVEFSYKSDEHGDPLINEDYIREMQLATPEELAHLRMSALKVNGLLGDFFAKCGLKLVDFKLEFGRLATDPSVIVLADEISPDGCRLWDLKTGEKMDKDRFRRDLGNVMEAYGEVLERVKQNLA